MNISLDYDGTYTEDPEAWDQFIEFMTNVGHRIWVVTLRCKEHDAIINIQHLGDLIEDIIYCDGEPKREIVDKHKIRIDVWIDDNPECVNYGSCMSASDLSRWRDEIAGLKIG